MAKTSCYKPFKYHCHDKEYSCMLNDDPIEYLNTENAKFKFAQINNYYK